eukprot:scaffold19163_cov103-Isochrysis_galbana.AAC.2
MSACPGRRTRRAWRCGADGPRRAGPTARSRPRCPTPRAPRTPPTAGRPPPGRCRFAARSRRPCCGSSQPRPRARQPPRKRHPHALPRLTVQGLSRPRRRGAWPRRGRPAGAPI